MRFFKLERRLIAHLFDGMLPSGTNERMNLSAEEAGVVEFFADHLAFLPARTRWGLRAAVDLAGVYSRLHPGGTKSALDGLAHSRYYMLREVVTLLKSVVCMGYFVDPRVRAELGLDLSLAGAAAKAGQAGKRS